MGKIVKLLLTGLLTLSVLSGCAVAPGEKGGGNDVAVSSLRKAEDNYRAGRLELARQQYAEVLRHDPGITEAKLKLANIDLRNGHLESAETQYRELIEENPRMQRAHYNLALAQIIQAEQHLRYFMALTPPDRDVSHILGLLSAIERFAKGNAAVTAKTPLSTLADTVTNGGLGDGEK